MRVTVVEAGLTSVHLTPIMSSTATEAFPAMRMLMEYALLIPERIFSLKCCPTCFAYPAQRGWRETPRTSAVLTALTRSCRSGGVRNAQLDASARKIGSVVLRSVSLP